MGIFILGCVSHPLEHMVGFVFDSVNAIAEAVLGLAHFWPGLSIGLDNTNR